MILHRRASNSCWICGAGGPLTGEHKIKKTDLRCYPTVAPKYKLLSDGKKQPIQGLNAKLLKFSPSICARCNNSTTQQADRSYERFRSEDTGRVRTTVDELAGKEDWAAEQEVDLSTHIDLARYFGKHLGCSLADSKFPIPLRLSEFVSGRSTTICVTLTTRVAPFWWQDETGRIGPLHSLGGAFITMSTGEVQATFAYQSTYMTDGVQFIIKMHLSMLEALELELFFQRDPNFVLREFSNEERKHRGLPYDE